MTTALSKNLCLPLRSFVRLLQIEVHCSLRRKHLIGGTTSHVIRFTNFYAYIVEWDSYRGCTCLSALEICIGGTFYDWSNWKTGADNAISALYEQQFKWKMSLLSWILYCSLIVCVIDCSRGGGGGTKGGRNCSFGPIFSFFSCLPSKFDNVSLRSFLRIFYPMKRAMSGKQFSRRKKSSEQWSAIHRRPFLFFKFSNSLKHKVSIQKA